MPATTTVRVSTSTRDLLREIAATRQQSVDEVITAALGVARRDERRAVAAAEARAVRDDPPDRAEIAASAPQGHPGPMTTTPSRALVLSGGGPLGIAWMAGLATGLAEAGTPLGGAGAVVGTSAGAVVGAQLALGRDPVDLLATLADSARALAEGPPMDLVAFSDAMTGAAAATSPEEGRRVIGAAALEATTTEQAAYVDVFAHLGGAAWPASFRCTAVDVDDGSLLVWDAATGVDLPRAVASSTAVPLVFPVIDVAGHRCMDGGLRSTLNADLAAGHDRALVLSCTALVPGPDATPYARAMAATHAVELHGLRAAGAAVEVVEPGPAFTTVSQGGANLFDFARTREAYDAGLGQAADEAARVGALWAV